MSRTTFCFAFLTGAAMLNALAMPCTAQQTFDFTSPDFIDGEWGQQQGWRATPDWTINSIGSGLAASDADTSISTYRTPVVLQNPNDTFGYSVNMQWDGSYTTPQNWTYLLISGLKTDSSNSSVATDPGDAAADINVQLMNPNVNVDFTDDYRLLNGFMGLAGATTIDAATPPPLGSDARLNEGDILQIDYEITLGTTEADTFYTAQLQNLTDGTDTGLGTVTGVSSQFYTALTTTGVFPFIQRHTPNPAAGGTGFTNLQINEISGDFGAPLPPEPPNPVFWEDNAPPSGTTNPGNIVVTATTDPNDASNDVGVIELGATGTFVNMNNGGEVDVSDFEGEKFRFAFDYLVPADTAFDVVEDPEQPNEDTFWAQVAFRDPVSATAPQGAGNSDSAGFPRISDVDDGVWRTIEVTGTIPPDSDGATAQITITDDGFLGGPADTFGNVMFVDNIIFEAVDRLPGDFDGNGIVDNADYEVWAANFGAAPPEPDGMGNYAYRDSTNLDGEAAINHNGDGMNGVDIADYNLWRDNLGATAASLNSVNLLDSTANVPEPSSIALCVCGFVAASWRRWAVRRCEVLA